MPTASINRRNSWTPMLIDLLAFSCISQQAVGLAPVRVETIIETVLSRLESDIQATKRARGKRPVQWSTVLAHEPSLVQVVSNLVSNALKFVRPGVPPFVRLWSEHGQNITPHLGGKIWG